MSARHGVKAPAAAGRAAQPAPSPARPAFTPVRTPMLLRACACGAVPGSGGKCSDCEKKDKQRGEKVVQRASTGGTAPGHVPPAVHRALDSPGQALDGSTRSFMESRFGHDFGRVRIHDDAAAAESARAVNARAYTVGQDVVFDSGRYSPHSDGGRHLLAHELAHTIQQGGVHRYADDVQWGGAMESHLEREAEQAAHRISQPQPGPAAAPWAGTRLAAPVISREKNDTATPATAGEEGADEDPGRAWEDIPPSKPLSKIASAQSALRPGEISPKIRAYKVKEPLPLPKEKGPVVDRWKALAAAGGLESVIDAEGNPKSMLKQERPVTDTLRKIWLTRVGWSKENAAQNWQAAGGDKLKTFEPKAGKNTCEMDHVVELQIGGNNTTENILPLDRDENGASGREIFKYLKGKAQEIRDITSVPQIILHFDSVTQGSPTCNICCQIAQKADQAAAVAAATTKPGADPTEPYELKAGSSTTLELPAGSLGKRSKAAKIPIAESELPKNQAASTLIPGMVLETLHLKPKKPDIVDAFIDTTNKKTRLPITIAKEKSAIQLKVQDDNSLKLVKKTTNIAFTYPYLSAGRITEFAIDEAGEVSWKGKITPSIPFVGALGVEYSKGVLLVTKGLDEAELKKKSLLGMKVTKAQLQMQLAPDFQIVPGAVIEAHLGKDDDPVATLVLNLGADDVGLVATGDLAVNIPKMKSATSKVTYKGGGGRNEWSAEIHIKSEDIQLGPSVTVSGGFDGKIDKGGLDFDGSITATFPGNNSARLGLKKAGKSYILSGRGTFHFPKLDETTVGVTYYLDRDVLEATGATGFKIPQLGLSGKLEKVTFIIAKGQDLKVSGKGGLDFAKGKAAGHVNVELHPNGKFTGDGHLSYQFNEKLKAEAGVELDDKERLKFRGKLTTSLHLFDKFGNDVDLFNLDINIPIPGASIGGVGLEVTIGGGVSVGYSVGPGDIRPLIFSADFYPLEENTDLSLALSGMVSIPASVYLKAKIFGGIVLDAFIAEVGGKVVLTGTITLAGGLFAPFVATYKQGKITAELTPEIKAALLLALALDLTAWAKAGIGWLSVKTEKTWNLAERKINTGIEFSLKAPLKYSTDEGVKLPGIDDIVLKKPEITKAKMKDILRQLVEGSDPKEREV